MADSDTLKFDRLLQNFLDQILVFGLFQKKLAEFTPDSSESVFSGMAKAVIHNSDYQSVAEAVVAIDRHFAERNQEFRRHPKRAGGKIWGDELVVPKFRVANNCKDPRWRS